MSETLRDLVNKRTARYFVDRQVEIDVFHRFIAPQSGQNILLISGIAGIGKTSLLSQYRLIAQQENIPIGLADLAVAKTPVAVMREWRVDLPDPGFEDFDLGLKQLDKITKEIAPISSSSSSRALSMAAEQFGKKSDDDVLSAEFIESTDYRLTRAFVDGITRRLKGQTPILMLDTFEFAEDSLAVWLTASLISLLPPEVRLVVAGRIIHESLWNSWSPLVINMRLAPFSPDVMAHYLQLRDIKQPEFIQTAQELTLGLPLTLALLADLGASGVDAKNLKSYRNQIVHGAVDRFFRALEPDPDLRKAIEAAAVMGDFNADMLSQFFGKDMRNEFEQLRQMSLIRSSPTGFVMQDIVRELVLLALGSDSPEYLRELRARAKSIHLTMQEKKLIELMGTERTSSPSDLSISLQVLQSEVDRIMQALRADGLVDQIGTSEDGEPLFSLTETGALLLKSSKEKTQ
jgi:DNA-binding MarR family transcriptional regulator